MSFESIEWQELLETHGGELMGFNLKELTDKELDMPRNFGSFGGSLRRIFYDQLETDRLYKEAETRAENEIRTPKYGPEFNTNLKIEIRIRDGNRCMSTQCSGAYEKICVHHIDYNRYNNDPSNLITLCASCNNLANYNRDWWKTFYQIIMQKRGIC